MNHNENIKQFKQLINYVESFDEQHRPPWWTLLFDSTYLITEDILTSYPNYDNLKQKYNDKYCINNTNKYSRGIKTRNTLPVEFVLLGNLIHSVIVDFVDGKDNLGTHSKENIQKVVKSYRKGLFDLYPEYEHQIVEYLFDYTSLIGRKYL